MQRIIFNNYLDASVCGLFMILVLIMAFFTIKSCLLALKNQEPTVCETLSDSIRGVA